MWMCFCYQVNFKSSRIKQLVTRVWNFLHPTTETPPPNWCLVWVNLFNKPLRVSFRGREKFSQGGGKLRLEDPPPKLRKIAEKLRKLRENSGN